MEYSAELLRHVRAEGTGGKRGFLYGRRRDTQIRLLAARRQGKPPDIGLTGLDWVGVFCVRSGGEVFLSEEDLELAGCSGASIALVLTPERGGFFFREADGSMLAIRSYQEFDAPPANATRSAGRSALKVVLNAVALSACLVLSVAAALYAEPKAALTFGIHEEAGQLVVEWGPGVRGTMEIRDGTRKLQFPVSVDETRATYQPESGDVNFVLLTIDGITREQNIRIVDSPRRKISSIPPLIEQIEGLKAERDRLAGESVENKFKIARLEKLVSP